VSWSGAYTNSRFTFGSGTVNPIANDVDSFWDALIEGKNGVAPLDGWDVSDMGVRIAGQVKNLDLTQHVEPREIRRTARFTQLALVAARQAVAMAGFPLKREDNVVDRDRIGIMNGTSIGSFNDIVDTVLAGGPEAARISPFFVPRSLGNMAAATCLSLKHAGDRSRPHRCWCTR
jgi:3-oxoacyl-[acyl-carrier-protein] synthase II